MTPDGLPKGTYWAAVPHGIVDAAIPDTLKLLLWLCYDRKEDWTYSVGEVAATMRRTPQCIRGYFRMLIAADVFKSAGSKKDKHGSYPIFRFAPAKVEAFVKRQLMANPEMDPETDPETEVETKGETDPETGVSHNDTNLTKSITDTHPIENHRTKKGLDASSSLNLSSGESPAAEGGCRVGLASTAVAPSPSDSNTIQYACGNSNAGGKEGAESTMVSVAVPIIQTSASGNTNTTAVKNTTGHSGTSATCAFGTIANSGGCGGAMPRDAEWCAKMILRGWKEAPFSAASLATMESEFRKRMAQENWKDLPSSFEAMQAVRYWKDRIEKEFGRYNTSGD